MLSFVLHAFKDLYKLRFVL